jgi:hypothetical protein
VAAGNLSGLVYELLGANGLSGIEGGGHVSFSIIGKPDTI